MAVAAVYPPRCLACGEIVAEEGGLCGPCWRETPFIGGLVCESCGVPLPGVSDRPERCDDCLASPRPWARGRAAVVNDGLARQLVGELKYHDRQDLVRPLAAWMARAAAPMLERGMLVAPVPLHWRRLAGRRYNQAAALAAEVARRLELAFAADLLVRRRATPALEPLGRRSRLEALRGSVAVHPRRGGLARGRTVLLVDDVMTSGATLSACAQAALEAGAARVNVLVLARTASNP